MKDHWSVIEATSEALEAAFFPALATALAALDGTRLVLVLGGATGTPYEVLAATTPDGPLRVGKKLDRIK